MGKKKDKKIKEEEERKAKERRDRDTMSILTNAMTAANNS